MRIRTSLLSAVAALAMTLPMVASAAMTQTFEGWPMWIGRVNYSLIPSASPARQMSQGPLYLPRSLVRTGGLQNLIEEVRQTKNTTNWPTWIEEVQTSGN